MFEWLGLAGLFLVGIIAGAINSVAGGGILLAFPALVASGETEIIANATCTAAMWPGSLSSMIAYRKDTDVDSRLLICLLIPSLAGGLFGAIILVMTPETIFERIAPFLVLFATLALASRDVLSRRLSSQPTGGDHVTSVATFWGALFQLLIAIYGGYFGAGIGILMLGSFSLMGFRDIHRMNAIKTHLATITNLTAFAFFAFKGLVAWPSAFVIAVGAITGGYGGARLAKRANPRLLHYCIILIGLLVSAWFFIKSY